MVHPSRPPDAFDRLNAASVGLLEPLYDPSCAADPTALAAALSQAITHCARTAESLGLRSLSYLSTLLIPYLQRHAGDDVWPQAREHVESWVGDVVAFCAGQLPDSAAARLVVAMQEWPDFPPVPAQFVQLISGRLVQDARLIAELLAHAQEAAGFGMPADLPSTPSESTEPMAQNQTTERAELTHELGPIHTDLRAEQPSSGPVYLQIDASDASDSAARDEFEMLADAVEALSADVASTLAAADAADPAQLAVATSDVLELYGERLGNIASAAGFVGVDVLGQLLRSSADAARSWAAGSGQPGLRGHELLGRLPAVLAAYLREPGIDPAAALADLFCDPGWPRPLAPDRVGEVARVLAGVELVDSRQVVTAPHEIAEADLSLAIPGDADARVVDNLLHELPVLSSQFAACVDEISSGGDGGLAQAQRIAHTIKGSANTVGVRGIATLTHQLEDLLQLLGRNDDRPPAELVEQLAVAADCLGEMTDAVAGLGPAPTDALQVCRTLAGWIVRLLGSDAPKPAAQTPATDEVVGDQAPPQSSAEPESAEPEPTEPESTEPESTQPAPTARSSPPGALDASTSTPGDDEVLRVPARLLDRLLDLAGEASMLLAQAQEQLAQLADTRGTLRSGSEGLQDIAGELERLVDIRGVSLTGRRGRGAFDPLELDEFDELHTVSRRLAEAAADGRLLERQLDLQATVLADVTGQLDRTQGDLHDAVMRTRTVPASAIVPRLQRAIRQAARMAGRQASLAIEGERTGIDAQLLQALVDPLTHLLRNAVDHGIEPPQQREQAGKSRVGRIRLTFSRSARRLAIHCSDDGRGLDFEAIGARARELGLIEDEASAQPDALARAILSPGFSTRREATQLSGRGIGLDVVQRAVSQLRGTIRIESRPLEGTDVFIEVPERMVTLAVMVVRTSSHVLALSIRGIEQLLPSDGIVEDAQGAPRFVYRDRFIPVRRLDEAIGLRPGQFERERVAALAAARNTRADPARHGEIAAIVVCDDGERVALIAPDPGQTRNVVVRPLPGWLARIDAIEGAAVLGDGSVAAVIDLPVLLAHREADAASAQLPLLEPAPQPRCLVVDDSVSVRRSMEAFMRDLGFEVDTAGDGIEALGLAERRIPDLAIIDLEMPRMNGIELAAALRADARTREVALIMITSRYSDKHRAMALDAGVDVFMTKPYTEDELASNVRRCLESRAAAG